MGVSCHGLFHKIGGGGTHEVGGIERLISFVKEHIIHRFGIPQTITTDGGSVFISEEFRKFADVLSVETHRRVATGNTKSREVAGALAGTAPSSTARNSVTRPEVLWKTGRAT